jgi:hypothetical protein
MTLYKLTSDTGDPVHGGAGGWDLPKDGQPGAWREVTGPLKPCEHGLHLLRACDLMHWLAVGTLWRVETEGERLDCADKVVVRRARLVHPVAQLNAHLVRQLACDFAERVLPIFERAYPAGRSAAAGHRRRSPLRG